MTSVLQTPKYPTQYELKILENQKEILSLLKRIIGKPTLPSVDSVIHLRDSGTNTPPPSIVITREKSTQSPINNKGVSNNREEHENDPIYARANNCKPYSCPADT